MGGVHVFSQEGVPVLVSVAFWMTLLCGALGLGASLVRLIQRVADWGFVHGGDQLAEGLLGTGALVVFALVCLLQILGSFKVREGLHGARVLLAILALPSMLLGVTVVATSGTMGGLAGAVSFMVVPFLWTETPQAWFRFHRSTRA